VGGAGGRRKKKEQWSTRAASGRSHRAIAALAFGSRDQSWYSPCASPWYTLTSRISGASPKWWLTARTFRPLAESGVV